MADVSLAGRVVRAADTLPLPNIAVRLVAPAAALAGITGALPLPAGQQITWTRQLSGFAGTRWDCWAKFLQNRVPGLTWEQFSDPALLHNPALNPDHLFRADTAYLIPELTPLPPYTWTRQATGLSGSRWDCWTSQIQNKVTGITWEQFCDAALNNNPQLQADGRMFKPEKTYLLPQNDGSPRALREITTDAQGNYAFTIHAPAAVCELQVEVAGYARFVLPVPVNGALTQPIALSAPASAASATTLVGALTPSAPAATSGSVRSAMPEYATLPDRARRVIDQALSMLGNDAQSFDSLPADLQKMTYGFRFVASPNDAHYKDIVCADLVSVALKSAGLDIGWGGGAGPSMADYYMPDGNPKLIEITNPADWLPGDVLIYGPSTTPGRKSGHVNLYVGAFAGTDRSGKTYAPSDGVTVVEGSMDFMQNGSERGTGVVGRTLQGYCLQQKCYTYSWVRHVRLRELAALFGR